MQIDCGPTVYPSKVLPGGPAYSAWEGSSADVEQEIFICS